MLIKETAEEGSDDQITRLGASLAYYAVFSIAPLLLVAVAGVGFVFGDSAARGAVFKQLSQFMGEAQAHTVEDLILSARQGRSGLAGVVSISVLLFAASAALSELQSALNRIFDVPKAKLAWTATIKQRLVALVFVLGAGVLLFASMIANTAISAAGSYLSELIGFPTALVRVANFGAALALLSFVFALMFRYLPLTRVGWGDAWKGSAVTALLFICGNVTLGQYLSKAGPVSIYGAAGSLLAVLLWTYYCAQIFYLGAEFTHVYSLHHAGVRH